MKIIYFIHKTRKKDTPSQTVKSLSTNHKLCLWILICHILHFCPFVNLLHKICNPVFKAYPLTIKFANCIARRIVHYEFVPTGQTVNQVSYLEVLKMLREEVRRKRPEIFANNSWILHHDNAPAHKALSVREFLATKQITVLGHPAYSPDLAPNDFFLFPKIKEILKGRLLMTLTTSGVIQQQLWRPFHKTSSKIV